MKRPALRPFLAALLLASGCTIDIPQSFYADASVTPPDTGGTIDVATPDGGADAGPDAAPPQDTAQTDVPDTAQPADVVADAGTDVADAGDGGPDTVAPDADAGAPDIQIGDVVFPPTCTLDEDCVPTGELPLCTEPRCVDGACKADKAPDGTLCDDPALQPTACALEQCKAAKCRLVELGEGTPCGVTDACFEDRCNVAGLCVAVSLVECDDGNACTTDSCDPDTGCQNVAAIGQGCDDGNACTVEDVCLADGSCAGTAPGCTADPCFKAVCNEETGACDQVPDTGALCDDGDPCTSFDKCSAAGVCVGSFKCPKPTGPKAACLKATCTADGTCGIEPGPGQTCNDGNGCTVPDICECPVGAPCDQTTIACGGAAVPIGRACEAETDCAYSGAKCFKNVCIIECSTAADCPQPPTNQGVASCEPLGPGGPSVCRIEKCIAKTGGSGNCVDGTCFE